MFDDFFSDNRSVYEIMWKTTVESDRILNTIWRKRIVCWITKTTETHSDYVTLLLQGNNV